MADLKDINDRQDPRVGVGQWLREEAGVGGSEAGSGRWERSISRVSICLLHVLTMVLIPFYSGVCVYNLHEVQSSGGMQ